MEKNTRTYALKGLDSKGINYLDRALAQRALTELERTRYRVNYLMLDSKTEVQIRRDFVETGELETYHLDVTTSNSAVPRYVKELTDLLELDKEQTKIATTEIPLRDAYEIAKKISMRKK
jgi:hypothetical protein